MRKRFASIIMALVLACALAAPAMAQQKVEQGQAEDITRETIVGPGSVDVQTGKDILMSFGATVRLIPTSENNWDFGMGDDVDGYIHLAGPNYALDDAFFNVHVNESGWVDDGYIRNEDKLYFNAMPKDRKWSFYAALEFDRPLDTGSVDSRGGRTNDDSNFGLERLHCTYALPKNLRFHAGWDVWHVDAIEAAGLVYGDDNPGFWLTGDFMDQAVEFNVGYFKLMENDFQTSPADFTSASDDDRDVVAGYVTMHFDRSSEFTNKLQVFYAYDQIRNVPVTDLMGYLTANPALPGPFQNLSAAGAALGTVPETDSHHLGFYYLMNYLDLEFFFEFAYQFGEAEDTGYAQDDFDISAHAVAADVSYDLKKMAGFEIKPHLGVVYTSGDSDPNDGELNGYNGIVNAQRFSQRWGGENTIIGDTNLVLGTILYGYLPEMYGNGTPVFTGGLQNVAGLGGGRGDNPGSTMLSMGLRMAPKVFLIYNTNVNFFWWNEDFQVINRVEPLDAFGNLNVSRVSGSYMGAEWDNEVTLAMSKNTFVKGQFSWFFPDDGVDELTRALGNESNDTIQRLAMEFIWNF